MGLNPAHDTISGTFGTDEAGQLRDESRMFTESNPSRRMAMFERKERIISHESWFINYPGFDISSMTGITMPYSDEGCDTLEWERWHWLLSMDNFCTKPSPLLRI
jgi:hypothetical protein